jgi:hypothetical protein
VADHSSAPEVLAYAHDTFHLWLRLDRGRRCIFVYIALFAKLEVSGCLHKHLDSHSAECSKTFSTSFGRASCKISAMVSAGICVRPAQVEEEGKPVATPHSLTSILSP